MTTSSEVALAEASSGRSSGSIGDFFQICFYVAIPLLTNPSKATK
jgi:hypothetical protein